MSATEHISEEIMEKVDDEVIVSHEDILNIDNSEKVEAVVEDLVGDKLNRFKENGKAFYRKRNNVFGQDSGIKGNVEGVVVDRDYDWDDYIEGDVQQYIPSTNEELRDSLTCINRSHEPSRIRYYGPTGSGKTLLGRFISHHKEIPLFTIQGHHRLRKKDLVGSRGSVNDEIVFDDGPLTKALLCSQERPAIVLFDEINRSPNESKSFFYSVLDERAEVHTGIGDEKIVGDKDNLIALATSNVGDIYTTNDMDPAEFDRFSRHIEVPYSDETRPEAIAENIIAPRCNMDEGVAKYLIAVGNKIRECINSRENTSLRKPLSTRRIITWASESMANASMEFKNPIYEASQQVITPLYMNAGVGSNDKNVIDNILNSTCFGLPVDREGFEEVKEETPEKAVKRLQDQNWKEMVGD